MDKQTVFSPPGLLYNTKPILWSNIDVTMPKSHSTSTHVSDEHQNKYKYTRASRWPRTLPSSPALRGRPRARSHRRFAPQLIYRTPDPRTHSVPLYLK